MTVLFIFIESFLRSFCSILGLWSLLTVLFWGDLKKKYYWWKHAKCFYNVFEMMQTKLHLRSRIARIICAKHHSKFGTVRRSFTGSKDELKVVHCVCETFGEGKGSPRAAFSFPLSPALFQRVSKTCRCGRFKVMSQNKATDDGTTVV